MNFSTAVSTCFSKYATFSGRAPRAEYWWWVLFGLICNVVFGIADTMIFGLDNGALLAPVVSVILALPGLAVTVRRLHDITRSGWWVFIVFIPLIGAIMLILWLIREGDAGENEFGPNPYGY
jgi:Predicted membrane protein